MPGWPDSEEHARSAAAEWSQDQQRVFEEAQKAMAAKDLERLAALLNEGAEERAKQMYEKAMKRAGRSE